MGEQLAAVSRPQARLRGGLAAAAVKHLGAAQHPAGVAADRAHELRLQAERGVTDAGGQRRVYGAAQGGVQQGRGVAAMNNPDRVVVLLARVPGEDDPALL